MPLYWHEYDARLQPGRPDCRLLGSGQRCGYEHPAI